MKTVNYLLMAGAVILFSAFTISTSIQWKVAEGHSIEFSGTEVEGIFKNFKGDVEFDQNDINKAKFAFKIDVNSINTGNGTKNKHAVSAKWFDAETYPQITFDSKSFSKTDKGYTVNGTMSIHGVKKEVSIPFTFNANTFKTKFSVNRMDYGVGTMKGMSKKVSDKIDLVVSIPVTK